MTAHRKFARLPVGLLLCLLLAAALTPGVSAAVRGSPLVAALPGAKVDTTAAQTGRRLQPILTSDRFALVDPPPTANIQVTYTGFSQAAHDAFEAAVQVWETRIVSSQVIHVKAKWEPLGSGILGSAGPDGFYIMDDDIVYPAALAEALCSCEGSITNELSASFNSSFSAWYLGTDGNTPADKYDFFTVVMHELGHGLGFLSSFEVGGSPAKGYWGLVDQAQNIYPLSFDLFEWSAETGGSKLTNTSVYPNGSTALKTELTDNGVYFGGPNAVAVNGGRVRLYAPSTWSGGSSNSHLDDATFTAGSLNALMTHQLANGEVIHDPGPLTLAIFRDIGWTTSESGVVEDTTPPTVEAPVAAVFAPQVLNSSAFLRVSWPEAADESGVASYELQKMKNNNGTWIAVPLGSPTQTSVDVQLVTGNTFDFRLRATDTEGNTSSWVTSAERKLRVLQENASAVTYTGAWKRPALSGASGGYVRHALVAGRRAKVTFTGGSVGFVTTLAPNRGICAIWVDGSFVENVDLYAASMATATTVRAYDDLGAGTHTLEVRVTGAKNASSTSTRVDVDAFLLY